MTLDTTLHDLRNHLAIAVASVHALLDGKLAPDGANLTTLLSALEAIDHGLPLRLAPSSEPQHGSSGSAALLEAVIEGSPYAKILVDQLGRIVLVNAQTEKLFGYARDELLGRHIEMLVPERFRSGHGSLRDAFHSAPVARPMGAGRDLYGRRSDGSEVPIEIGLNPIQANAGAFTLAAISDITERKHAEELRLRHSNVEQHAAELEVLNRGLADASRFKTQFVATMSHELRTPLTAIVGASELLARSQLDERASISVETIAEAAQSLLSLINSVLDFSKIEAGKIELQTKPFSIEPVVEGTAEVVAQLARAKGVTLYTYVDPTIPPLQGDADRLRQILLNLIGNAVKFTDRGSVVARAFNQGVSGSTAVVSFEVEDTGIGIDPEAIPLLFEPFTQARSVNARNGNGTGLGLSIARSLVELMGGEIGVRSTVGAGSLFWFTARFPIAADPGPSREHVLHGTAGLVVSGDDSFAEIIERYLASWSMESRRIATRDGVIEAMQDDKRAWIAIVDLENVGIVDMGVTIDVLRAVVPTRVIAIGGAGALRKPIRQSQLYDAIVKAVGVVDPQPIGEAAAPAGFSSTPDGAVLVAEDNAQLQRLLKLQFDELGVPVVFVWDGRQAVDAVRAQRFSLVFMDCQMPVLDGLAATRAIRAEERTRGGHTPIAAMTANAFAEDREACLAAGMDDYLAKPVRLSDLQSMIQRWSRQRKNGA